MKFCKFGSICVVWFNGEWHQSWVSKWEDHNAKWYKKRGDPSNRRVGLPRVTSHRSFGKRIFISIRCGLHIPVTSTISRIAPKTSQCAFIPSWFAHGAWFGHHLFNIGACLWSFPSLLTTQMFLLYVVESFVILFGKMKTNLGELYIKIMYNSQLKSNLLELCIVLL